MFDLSIIKMGLEYAQFKDYRVRDALNELMKGIEKDMEEVGFDISPITRRQTDQFEALLTDIETANIVRPLRIELDEDPPAGVRERIVDIEETGDAQPIKVVSVDDELDEFMTERTTNVPTPDANKKST